MKQIWFLMFAALFAMCSERNTPAERTEAPLSCDFSLGTDTLSREDTIKALAVAFAVQESGLDHTALSTCGRYAGCLQMARIMVREANRIVGYRCFMDGTGDDYTDDRYNRQCSYAMFKIVQEHRNPTLNLDKAVDIWNEKCPKSYRDNVKNNFLSALEDSELRNYFD